MLSSRVFLPVEMEADRGKVELSAGGERFLLHGELFELDADGPLETHWSLERREFLVLGLRVLAHEPAELRGVSWLPGQWDSGCQQVVNSTKLQDAFLFLRRGNVSVMVSLDFPYSRITERGVQYAPHRRLAAGESVECHSLSIGACRLSGERVGDFDRAEIEAASAYVERRFPPRFERPMFVSSCITNRMTDVRDGRIFYSIAATGSS